jgi:large subunit ribosomal protein L14e
MPYSQFVEIGRVALVSYGPLVDELAVISDVVDDKRVLIDVVKSADGRQVIAVRRLKLTDLKVEIARGAAPNDVSAAVAAADVSKKFAETNWGKKLAANKARLQLTDFQRFKYAGLVAKRAELLTVSEKGGKGKQGGQVQKGKGGKK